MQKQTMRNGFNIIYTRRLTITSKKFLIIINSDRHEGKIDLPKNLMPALTQVKI